MRFQLGIRQCTRGKEPTEIGEQRGNLKGSVQIYEGLLGASVLSDDVLSKKSTEELVLIVTQLHKRLRDPTSWPHLQLALLAESPKELRVAP